MSDEMLDIDDGPVPREDYQNLYADYEAEKARHEITKADLVDTLDMLHEALDVARTIAEGARAVNLENRRMIDELNRILKG